MSSRVSPAPGEVLPPLPDPGPVQAAPDDAFPTLGCYRIDYVTAAAAPEHYQGTLRLEVTAGRPVASGDLYRVTPGARAYGAQTGVPVFPLKDYHHYLRVIRLASQDGAIRLEFELRRYATETVKRPEGTSITLVRWLNDGTFLASMAPVGAPSRARLAGDVVDSEGAVAGRLTMDWVSAHLRKATIEFTHVRDSEIPRDNASGQTWRTVFDQVGWDIALVVNDRNLEEPSGESWSASDAHAAIAAAYARSDLDADWRYQILCVRRIDLAVTPIGATEAQIANGERGYMFDTSGGDMDNFPRQSLMVASNYVFPVEDMWGQVQGLRAGSAPVPYFRTAVHELGHAMGLKHNSEDTGFMTASNDIAKMSLQTPEVPFPKNVMWKFTPEDEKRLRHWPDPVVRPGGIGWGGGDRSPTSTLTEIPPPHLRLDVSALSPTVPLAAPVRVELSLTNTDETLLSMVPASLSLMSGAVRGTVTDSSGTVRSFSPLVIAGEAQVTFLEPGASLSDSLSLLRGRDGALFPLPGNYRIVVEVRWQEELKDFVITGETTVTVTPAADAAHAEVARKVLATPDTLLVLALGGDHLKEGIDAIQAALAHPVLRPHFAYAEARRVGRRFGQRKADLRAAAALIDATTVMSSAELRKAQQMAANDADNAGAQAMARALAGRSTGMR